MSPKFIPSDALTVLEADERDERWLVELQVAPTLRYCEGRDSITYSANLYTPIALVVKGINYGEISNAGVTVVLGLDDDNDLITDVYASKFEGATMVLTQLVRADEAEDWATGYDPLTAPISEVSGSGATLVLRVRGVTDMRRRGGPKVGSIHCRHVFKNNRCEPTWGGNTCPRTWTACTARAATDDFGGLRWCPDAGDEILVEVGRWIVPEAPRDQDESPFRPRRITPRQLRPAIASTTGRGTGGKR